MAGNASLETERTGGGDEVEIEKMLAEAEATDAKEDRQAAAQRGAALPKALAAAGGATGPAAQVQEKIEAAGGSGGHAPAGEDRSGGSGGKATGKRKRGRKPKAADPSIDTETTSTSSTARAAS